MNQALDKSLYYLTSHENINAVTIEELEKLVNDYPYFAVSHFLLSKKLKDENDRRFLQQVQKTALYFPNPYWLHYQLLNDVPDQPVIHESDDTKIDKQGASVVVEEKPVEFSKDAIAHQVEHAVTTKFTAEEIKNASNLAHESLKEIHAKELINQEENGEPAANTATKEFEEEAPLNSLIEDDSATEKLSEQPVAEIDRSKATDDIKFETTPEISSTLHPTYQTSSPYTEPAKIDNYGLPPTLPATSNTETNEVDEIKEPDASHNDYREDVSQPEEEMAALTRDVDETTTNFLEELEQPQPKKENVDPPVEEGVMIKEISSSKEPETLTEAEPVELQETKRPEDIDEHEQMFQNIKAMLDASAEDANADIKNAVVPIDPYYTVDYFASQGIKLDFEKNPQDKLGKQVKKFTQWLKHMKKVGPEEALLSESLTPAEVEAQHIANASNTAREVVTEAMALVLEKQGKKDKAIQLYRKLTFLNPNKSAYFAAKIKNLNGN